MISVRLEANGRPTARLARRCASLSQFAAASACALALFAASHAPALAYSPDQLALSPRNIPRIAATANPGPARSAPGPIAVAPAQTSTRTPGTTAPAAVPNPPESSAPRPIVVAAVGSPPLPGLVTSAPGISQFDGTIWAESNCGPTSLTMALGALGIHTDQITLRTLANAQMQLSDPNVGTTWESLAAAAHHFGVSTSNLYQNGAYRAWTIDDLKKELAQGHPVLLLTHYEELPNHLTSTYPGDHYVVALGVDASGNILYNDPASKADDPFTHAATPDQLLPAWSDTNFGLARTAMALWK